MKLEEEIMGDKEKWQMRDRNTMDEKAGKETRANKWNKWEIRRTK
jgi:hypothetical protein